MLCYAVPLSLPVLPVSVDCGSANALNVGVYWAHGAVHVSSTHDKYVDMESTGGTICGTMVQPCNAGTCMQA